MDPNVYEKTPHAMMILKMEKNLSDVVIGDTSPYPTVVIVVKAQ